MQQTLSFDSITVKIFNSKLWSTITGHKQGESEILKGINGKISSGQVMAIIGPSGAGKTTLLETLALQPKIINNKNIKIYGEIKVDNQVLSREYMAKYCSFMPQNDSLWPSLTCYENLMYCAKLYNTFDSEETFINDRINDVINSLGLSSCKDVPVGSPFIRGLSGGQRRRVSLGCELMKKNIKFLFLDEPTSGLDAASAAEIMKLINKVSKDLNVGIITSIHQPSSHIFYEFDQLLLISKGRTAYFGKANESIDYFKNSGKCMEKAMNPADFLLEIVNSDFNDNNAEVDNILSLWEERESNLEEISFLTDDEEIEEDNFNNFKSICSRIYLLVCRTFLSYKRDPALYLLRVLMYGFMSVFLGLTYYDVTNTQKDIPDMFFCILWVTAFFSYMGMVSLPAFSIEKDTAVKEITNGMYGLAEYVTSISLVQVPIILLCSIVASVGPYWIPVLNNLFTRYLSFLAIFAMHLYVVESLGVLIASIIPNFVIGLIIFCSALSQMFVFNGFFISVANMPKFLIWIYYTSPFAYTNQALFKIVFSGQKMHGMNKCLRKLKYPCYGDTGNDVLDAISNSDLNYNDINIWEWFGVLIAFAIIMRFSFYYYLRSSVFDVRKRK